MTRVALVGGNGKLGSIIREVVDSLDGFEVTQVLGSGSSLADLDSAELIIDASNPSVSMGVVQAAAERRIPVLVGTSGWSAERISSIRAAVNEAGTAAVFIPNFSLGSVLGSALAAAAAPYFDSSKSLKRTGTPRSTRRVALLFVPLSWCQPHGERPDR